MRSNARIQNGNITCKQWIWTKYTKSNMNDRTNKSIKIFKCASKQPSHAGIRAYCNSLSVSRCNPVTKLSGRKTKLVILSLLKTTFSRMKAVAFFTSNQSFPNATQCSCTVNKDKQVWRPRQMQTSLVNCPLTSSNYLQLSRNSYVSKKFNVIAKVLRYS